MRKVVTLLAVLVLTLGMVGAASATEHGEPWPGHGHIMLLHVDYDAEGEPESYGKCVDIANSERLDRVHHTTIHTGRAGRALQRAGHLVVPTQDLAPWADCDGFAAMVLPPR